MKSLEIAREVVFILTGVVGSLFAVFFAYFKYKKSRVIPALFLRLNPLPSYTFIMEYAGGTYITQVNVPSGS